MEERRGSFVSGMGFYALICLLAATLVHFSVGSAPKLLRAAPQIGTEIAVGWAFDPAALQYATPNGLEAYVPRGRAGTPLGLRLAAQRASGDEIGARLEISPQWASAVAGQRLRVIVDVVPLEVTSAAALAVRIEGQSPGPWNTSQLTEGKSMQLTYDFQVPPEGMRAIWLRPVPPARDDYAFGTQIQRVEIALIPAPAGNRAR